MKGEGGSTEPASESNDRSESGEDVGDDWIEDWLSGWVTTGAGVTGGQGSSGYGSMERWSPISFMIGA